MCTTLTHMLTLNKLLNNSSANISTIYIHANEQKLFKQNSYKRMNLYL